MNFKSKLLKPTVIVPKVSGELGIENLKTVTTVVVTFTVDIIEIIKTKNYLRLFEVVLNLIRFGNIIEVAKQAWPEILNLSGQESKQWNEHFQIVLDLEDDATEALIEQGFSFIPRVYQLVQNGIGVVAGARELYAEIVDLFDGEETTELKNLLKNVA